MSRRSVVNKASDASVVIKRGGDGRDDSYDLAGSNERLYQILEKLIFHPQWSEGLPPIYSFGYDFKNPGYRMQSAFFSARRDLKKTRDIKAFINVFTEIAKETMASDYDIQQLSYQARYLLGHLHLWAYCGDLNQLKKEALVLDGKLGPTEVDAPKPEPLILYDPFTGSEVTAYSADCPAPKWYAISMINIETGDVDTQTFSEDEYLEWQRRRPFFVREHQFYDDLSFTYIARLQAIAHHQFWEKKSLAIMTSVPAVILKMRELLAKDNILTFEVELVRLVAEMAQEALVQDKKDLAGFGANINKHITTMAGWQNSASIEDMRQQIDGLYIAVSGNTISQRRDERTNVFIVKGVSF